MDTVSPRECCRRALGRERAGVLSGWAGVCGKCGIRVGGDLAGHPPIRFWCDCGHVLAVGPRRVEPGGSPRG